MMQTHLKHLMQMVPNLKSRQVIDVGAGDGTFLIDCARNEICASGIELNPEKVKAGLARALDLGISIDLIEGNAENIPYSESSFDFVNLSETIEHVRFPEKVVSETFRVLASGGYAYISVPNRFSWYDTHFHIPFVNWLPRRWSDAYISLWGKHKKYLVDTKSDFQRLAEMHYYTFPEAQRLFNKAGFEVKDLRMQKLYRRFGNGFVSMCVLIVYQFLRPWYFRAFHFLVYKP